MDSGNAPLPLYTAGGSYAGQCGELPERAPLLSGVAVHGKVDKKFDDSLMGLERTCINLDIKFR